MNAQALATQLQEFQQKALDIANRYDYLAEIRADQITKEQGIDDAKWGTSETKLAGRIRSALCLNFRGGKSPYDTVDEFDGNRFSCSYSYNDACNCHPEYVRWYLSCPTAWIDLEGEELDQAIKVNLDQRWAKLQEELAGEAKKAAEEAEQKRLEAERKERETFERLRNKYEK